jgi:plastocyanin
VAFRGGPKLAIAAAGLVAIAGCGGDDGEGSGRTVTVQAREGVHVAGDEYSFDPDTIVVEGGGGSLEITLDNQGAIAHNLAVFDGETEIGATPTFPGGESASVQVGLEPGSSYRMVCTVGDHEELGMVGELEVGR